MTVWTNVKLNELNNWLETRALTQATSITPIEDGVEDSVFRVDFENGSTACLRLFERTEPEGSLEIAALLASYGLPTCPPILDKEDRYLLPLKGKPATLYPWVDGQWVEKPTLAQVESVGRFLGQVACIAPRHCHEWHRDNPRGWTWFQKTTQKLLAVLPPDEKQELQEEVALQLSFWPSADVPKGPIHADMFRNNVLFNKRGNLVSVIDWGFCASDYPLIFDLAIVANDWCLQQGKYCFDEARLRCLLEGRAAVCPLTDDERASWRMALRWAALRFWLSRLHDWHFPRDPSGKKYDPDHFRKVLRTCRENSERALSSLKELVIAA